MLLLASLLCLTACAKHPLVTAPGRDPRQGEAAYRFLFDSSIANALPEDQELSSPRALTELAAPVYPQSALDGGADAATVAVRIIIGTDGKVVSVIDSPQLASTSGPFATDFRRAVEEAVLGWHFSSGELLTLQPGEDFDGDGEPDYRMFVGSEAVAVYYDVVFEFRVTDGKPEVTAATPRGHGP